MAYKTPKPGATIHPIKVDLPVELLQKIDAFGKSHGIKTRNTAIIEFISTATAPLGTE